MKTTILAAAALVLASNAAFASPPKHAKKHPHAPVAHKPHHAHAPARPHAASTSSPATTATFAPVAPRPVARPVASVGTTPVVHVANTAASEAPTLIRLQNDDAGVSILVPRDFTPVDGGANVSIAAASQNGTLVGVLAQTIEREDFRNLCRGLTPSELVKTDDVDLCMTRTSAGLLVGTVWIGDGHVVLAQSTTMTPKDLATFAGNAASTVLVASSDDDGAADTE